MRQAFDRLLDAVRGRTPFPANLICLVTASGGEHLLADLADRATAAGVTTAFRDGASLGQEIERALASDTWERLRQRLGAADVIVVERLDSLGGHRRQAGLRQLLDATLASGIPWCVSLRKPPAEAVEPPLAARLAGGLVVMPPASPFGGDAADTHQLRGGAVRLPDVGRIISTTARHFGLRGADLMGSGRCRKLAHARGLAMYLARELTGCSFAVIGRACGGRDHTTALHATRVIAERLASDATTAADAAAILARLGGVGRRPPARRSGAPDACR